MVELLSEVRPSLARRDKPAHRKRELAAVGVVLRYGGYES
jgi:hypothetical protein